MKKDIPTNEVFNQSKPLENYNVFDTNSALVEAVNREGAAWAVQNLTEFGSYLGRAETIDLATQANRFGPTLRAFDRYGTRVDQVDFHPAYHACMQAIIAQGVHSSPWVNPCEGAHVARAAAAMMHAEIESGTLCPVTMTYGSVPALQKSSGYPSEYLDKIYSRIYDKRFLPIDQKNGALIGMGMTEKQGGSDVRANTTRAELVDANSGEYIINGHKWFFSAPMCDAFLVLAQTKQGLSCFFLPRFLPDGEVNNIQIQRLKDKLGNRSNASSEVEFHDAHGWLLGLEGRGVPTIIEMATYTRLDCALGSTGIMHQAVSQAVNHCNDRAAFGHKLVDQPLMQNVLADLILEVEGATALIMRLARSFDHLNSENEADFARIMTPAAKYFICKRGTTTVAESMEVLGGNGYVEDGTMARHYKEIPLNSIWEGSGNVMCVDLLRAIKKSSSSFDSVRDEWRSIHGENKDLDEHVQRLESDLSSSNDLEYSARRIAERLALAVTASLLLKNAPSAVSDAFCSSRLRRDWGSAFGTLNPSSDLKKIIERGQLRPVKKQPLPA